MSAVALLISEARSAAITLRAAAQAELIIGGDYCRRQAEAMTRKAERLDDLAHAAAKETAP
jgi:hypothetical protein